MPRGRSFITLRGWDGREAGDAVPQAIMNRLTFAEFVDATDGDDVLTLRFENHAMDLFDSGLLFHWSRFAVVYGYEGGEVSPRRIMEVQDIRGGDEIEVVMHEGHELIGTDFMFFDVNRPNSRISIPDRNVIGNTRGFIYGLNSPGLPDQLLLQRVVEIIGGENGYTPAEIIWRETPPTTHPLVNDWGFYVSQERGAVLSGPGREETGRIGEPLTYAKILDILMGAMDWRWRIHNGLLILEPNDWVEDAALEVLYKTTQGVYSEEFQRQILDGTLDIEADVRQLPRMVQARGFDPATGRHITAEADTTGFARRVPRSGRATTSPTDRSTVTRTVETTAINSGAATAAAGAALTSGEKDLVTMKCDIEGTPRIPAGALILMTCPSIVISGGYTISEAIHKIIDERSPYKTAYTLERRFVQKVQAPPETPAPPPPRPPVGTVPLGPSPENAALIEKAIKEGNFWYQQYNSGGTLSPKARPGDPDKPPSRNIPQH